MRDARHAPFAIGRPREYRCVCGCYGPHGCGRCGAEMHCEQIACDCQNA